MQPSELQGTRNHHIASTLANIYGTLSFSGALAWYCGNIFKELHKSGLFLLETIIERWPKPTCRQIQCKATVIFI